MESPHALNSRPPRRVSRLRGVDHDLRLGLMHGPDNGVSAAFAAGAAVAAFALCPCLLRMQHVLHLQPCSSSCGVLSACGAWRHLLLLQLLHFGFLACCTCGRCCTCSLALLLPVAVLAGAAPRWTATYHAGHLPGRHPGSERARRPLWDGTHSAGKACQGPWRAVASRMFSLRPGYSLPAWRSLGRDCDMRESRKDRMLLVLGFVLPSGGAQQVPRLGGALFSVKPGQRPDDEGGGRRYLVALFSVTPGQRPDDEGGWSPSNLGLLSHPGASTGSLRRGDFTLQLG